LKAMFVHVVFTNLPVESHFSMTTCSNGCSRSPNAEDCKHEDILMLGVQLWPLLSTYGGLVVNDFYEVRHLLHLLLLLPTCIFSCCQGESRPLSC